MADKLPLLLRLLKERRKKKQKKTKPGTPGNLAESLKQAEKLAKES